MKPAIILLLIVAINFSCSSPVDQAALKAEIQKANDEFTQAMSKKDANALVQLYTEDARLMLPHIPAVEGRENLRKFFEQTGEGASGIKLSIEEVKGTDEFALETGKYELMAGDEKVDEGNYMVEWKKVDGKWLLHRDMAMTSVALPQPVAESVVSDQ